MSFSPSSSQHRICPLDSRVSEGFVVQDEFRRKRVATNVRMLPQPYQPRVYPVLQHRLRKDLEAFQNWSLDSTLKILPAPTSSWHITGHGE